MAAHKINDSDRLLLPYPPVNPQADKGDAKLVRSRHYRAQLPRFIRDLTTCVLHLRV